MPEVTLETLNAAAKRQVLALRRPVMDAARQFGAVRERLSDLAPKIVKLFNMILADNEAFTFVSFVRLFDPTVPTHAADRNGETGYRNHRTYYTLAYMRRLVQLQGTRRRTPGGVRDSATDALARTLATVLQVVEDSEAVWHAIQSEFQFTERLMTRLRKRVDATKPLIQLEPTRRATVSVGKVIHMERTEPTQAEAAQADTIEADTRGTRKRARAA
jgi:hypothetical protein